MNVQVIVEDLENNPQCFHGPCLLFRRNNGARTEEYYACSACRDHRECPFVLKISDRKQMKSKSSSKWINIRADLIQDINAKKPYKKYLKILNSLKTCRNKNLQSHKTSEDYNTDICKQVLNVKRLKKNKRCKQEKSKEIISTYGNKDKTNELKGTSTSAAYCCSCSELLDDINNGCHKECNVLKNLTEYQLKHPTEIITPKKDSKTHAQYFFTKDTVQNIVLLLSRINTKRVLCIGAPRVHEYLMNDCTDQIKSILLDIDLKYYNFYSEEEFIWFNMFNNFILNENSNKVLKEFLSSEKVTILIDPPFGGRVEPLAYTLNALNKLYLNLNKFHREQGDEDEKWIEIMWIFPYFMERHIKATFPNFNMFDLKIDYDNHSSFTSIGNRKRKFGSPIRIFTNIALSRLNLEGVDGYKFCELCRHWVARENRHCEECNSCTSKDGRTYRHCWACSRCVKPTYKHCKTCKTCTLPNHECGDSLRKSNCFHCLWGNHKKRECPVAQKSRKRRLKGNNAQMKQRRI